MLVDIYPRGYVKTAAAEATPLCGLTVAGIKPALIQLALQRFAMH
jgi:hypothetical protein